MQKFLHWLDNFQRKNRAIGFTVAVIKKYSDDQTGRNAALLTHYMFLSIFPLLLILTTVISKFLSANSTLKASIIKDTTNYFPLLGNQLTNHVHTLNRSGLPLILGLLFILYGTRGVADAFGRGVRQIWGVPESDMSGFPNSLARSISIVVVGGIGFIAAALAAGLAASVGHNILFRSLSSLISLVIIFFLFTFLINACLPAHVKIKQIRGGAAAAAIGLAILQLLGGYVVSRELKNLDALYSYFAVALGLLFWLYLQIQVVFYAIEIAVVSSRKLWPVNLF